jgi:CheY-like chemotaxis protein
MVSPEKQGGRPTILVAEDDTGLRDIVVEILEASGYDVVPADDGRQAIEYLSSTDEAPAAVLLDLMMPICSGWDCLRAMRADDRLAYIPVVVMSELEMSELERAPAGADLFLRKPFRVDELLETIDHFAHPHNPSGNGTSFS